ncbi:MAG: hypothetical protein GX180_13940 [Enterococcus sp.]|nr:hypothetical protein [Enterococcus sp.]
MTALVYIHLDTISNTVLTKGLTARDFQQGIVHQPKNLLLLNPTTELGEHESHTALKIVRGTEAIQQFFQISGRTRQTNENKWIDFSDLNMLKELTPLEISELLYFGHMKTHLHSPFFYKLQNNFVYFELESGLNRTYYRYIDEFYRILALKITRFSLEKLNERRTFFRKTQPVEKLNYELLKTLKEAMKEGLVFSFEDASLKNNELQIPILFAEERTVLERSFKLKQEYLLGYLTFHCEVQSWTLDLDDELFDFHSKTMPFL